MSAGSEGLSNRVGRWRVLPESPPLGLPQLKPHSHLTQMASLQPSYTSQKEQERSNGRNEGVAPLGATEAVTLICKNSWHSDIRLAAHGDEMV